MNQIFVHSGPVINLVFSTGFYKTYLHVRFLCRNLIFHMNIAEQRHFCRGSPNVPSSLPPSIAFSTAYPIFLQIRKQDDETMHGIKGNHGFSAPHECIFAEHRFWNWYHWKLERNGDLLIKGRIVATPS